jgi:hypothetical protein
VQKSSAGVEVIVVQKEKCPAYSRAKFQNKRILTRSPWVKVCVCSIASVIETISSGNWFAE